MSKLPEMKIVKRITELEMQREVLLNMLLEQKLNANNFTHRPISAEVLEAALGDKYDLVVLLDGDMMIVKRK